MKLTDQGKKHIDALSYEGLLEWWRNAPCGDPWFEGDTGRYWRKRMDDLRTAGADVVGASKRIGWGGNETP